ncbi:response regulator transcription factor [Actinoplanes sp. NPDC049596]|uniref:response regulator n=1 Tax=unclassified Actinoplanes TaxID=2626549 RepID=UPI003433B49B
MRVVIVEDHVLLAEGLRLMLELEGATVVAVLHTAEEFLATIGEHAPDVTITDVRLPPAFSDEGVRAAAEARRRWPGLPVLVLSQYVEHVYSAELLAEGAGGVGYLLKDRVSRVDEFLDALRRVAAGGTAIDPEVRPAPGRQRTPPGTRRPDVPELLTAADLTKDVRPPFIVVRMRMNRETRSCLSDVVAQPHRLAARAGPVGGRRARVTPSSALVKRDR